MTIGDQSQRLNFPTSIAIRSGTVYISESDMHYISVFTSKTGFFATTFGKRGNKQGEFEYSLGLAVDDAGVVYVCDNENDRVQLM